MFILQLKNDIQFNLRWKFLIFLLFNVTLLLSYRVQYWYLMTRGESYKLAGKVTVLSLVYFWDEWKYFKVYSLLCLAAVWSVLQKFYFNLEVHTVWLTEGNYSMYFFDMLVHTLLCMEDIYRINVSLLLPVITWK